VICETCQGRFRRFGADGEIHRKHCYQHHGADKVPDPLAVMRLRRAYTSSEPTYAIVRPALNADERAEAARRREEASEAWRSAPDPEPTTDEDRLIAALHLPELVEAA
jgi:hypothetical protein